MTAKPYRLKLRIISAAIMILLGFVLTLFVVGHSYLGSAFIFFGSVILIYTWFHFAADKHPRLIRILKRILSVILIVGTLYFAFLEVLIIGDAKTETDTEADYIIVLGAGVNGTVPSLSLSNRLYAALDYLETHPHTVAVVSGGQGPGEDITEAQCMYDWLVDRGIDADRVIMEPQATSTEENLKFSKEIIDERTGSEVTIGIVSSEYHLYRAKLMAEKIGIDAIGIAGRTSYPSLAINYFIREAFGVTHFYVFGY